MIYGLFGDLINKGIHALSLRVFTENEWDLNKSKVAGSPDCASS